jgi:hypothetical protein
MLTFSQQIKKLKKEDLFWFLKFSEKNSYFNFIEKCQFKKLLKEKCHKHHIIPKFLLKDTIEEREFCDSKKNIILLLIEDHKKAHLLFYQNYKDPRNLGAINLLNGSMSKALRYWRQAGAYASHQKQIKTRGYLFSNEHQKKAAALSLARPDSIEIRRRGGKKGGRRTQENRIVCIYDKYLWFYKKKPIICTFNCKTGQDILEELQYYKKTNLQRVSPLIKKTRLSAYGWSCIKCYNFQAW